MKQQQQQHVILLMIIAMMVVNVYAEHLEVTIFPIRPKFGKTEEVVMKVKYTNKRDQTISIYNWCLQENELDDNLFEVTCDGIPVEYTGPCVKRREPKDEDMTLLPPGKTRVFHARLSTAYDMTKT
ncbi:unnamed protein product, partial [Rotaria sordida]